MKIVFIVARFLTIAICISNLFHPLKPHVVSIFLIGYSIDCAFRIIYLLVNKETKTKTI